MVEDRAEGALRLTPEKVSELKEAVRDRIKKLGVDQEVRRVISEHAGSGYTKEQAMDALQEKGLILQLVQAMGAPETLLAASKEPGDGPSATAENKNRRYLSLQVKAGRAFTPYVAKDAPPGTRLQLHAEIFGQRLRSAAVEARPEPAFGASALVELPGSIDSEPISLAMLRQPLRVAVVQILGAAGGRSEHADHAGSAAGDGHVALGCASVEWRRVLTAGVGRRIIVMAELAPYSGSAFGPAAGAGLPVVGTVEIALELVPPFATAMDALVLKKQLQAEAAADADRTARFMERAREWWSGYVALSPLFRERLVKVLAYGEDGAQRPVCGYVSALRLGRSLSTPREAARWVSLLTRAEEQADAVIFGGASKSGEAWHSLHTVVATRCASKEERAVLLCSILLGFGLDAWVAVGRDELGGHMWALTFAGKAVTFWEPATGERFEVTDPEALEQGCPYETVDCIFNDCRLYANRQVDNSAALTRYHLQDAALWYELRVDRDREVPGATITGLQLQARHADASALEMEIETRIRAILERFRWNAMGLVKVNWSSTLSYMLMPALAAYEQEAATGQPAAGNAEFQQSVKRMVPVGSVFKGFPLHFAHADAEAIGAALSAEPAVQEMLSQGNPNASFGLRVKVFPYPEGTVSVWAMMCVTHPA